MKLENFINYYYAKKALQYLLEHGLISKAECETACRHNAEIFRPGRGVHLATLGMDFRPGFW